MVGMAWLGQLSADTPFLLGIELPMLLVGVGMGSSLASLTIAGVAGVAREDAGSASGVVGVAHQLGGALGLAVMVVVFASVDPLPVTVRAELAHRIAMALSAGAVMLALALVLVFALIVRPSQAAKQAAGAA